MLFVIDSGLENSFQGKARVIEYNATGKRTDGNGKKLQLSSPPTLPTVELFDCIKHCV